MKRLIILLAIMLSSCVSYKKIPQTIHPPSNYSLEIIKLFSEAWPYAQLSLNVYEDSDSLNISNLYTVAEKFEYRAQGFNAILYKHTQEKEYVLAFRGTDEGIDFKYGNNPISQKQNETGLKVFDHVVKLIGDGNKIIVTGHSLGGGIAMGVSLNRSNVSCYSFNGSPVFKKKNKLGKGNIRHSIVEYGDPLKIVKMLGREATQTYTSVNLTPGTKKQHSIKNLAIGITQIAAITSTEAIESLKMNNISAQFDYDATIEKKDI
ncbi:Mbeg1-like protein [Flammeovirga aprica]|uniref:DUF2974 domain-containing protein n=1 Tax=Flammeovirga aprica JL-4 TaxID=694437 RepID=A0A7X9S1R1_9BACT|nr:Mbeg1-like protein [Flammeovirga aprica]NME72797.1 DUF2974 domain-containing protein [Flammeovirga aprica JL-4]